MLILYTLTIFVSAALLFLVQPMFARMVLPLLGGSPAVWNTALVFFQAALLAGYAYVHASTTKLGVREQAVVHLIVLAVPLLLLPIVIPRGWTPPSQGNPVPWLLALLAVAVGLPFFAVSTTSPVLQRWFAASGHKASKDPYFLYAASNVGSMLALLAYPFLLEPRLTLRVQNEWWRDGYALFALLMLLCAIALWRTPQVLEESPQEIAEADQAVGEKISWARRARWVALSLVPSSLMIGVTTYLSNEIAAIPLLWIVPLTLYLLSFIVVFASRPLLPAGLAARAFAIFVLPLAVTLTVRAVEPMILLIPLHLITLFLAALMCHGEIARDRPSTRHLTEFYLWMSVGGVLGGAFNALLAPMIFSGVSEYPIAIVAACLLMPQALLGAAKAVAPSQAAGESKARKLDWMLPLIVGVVTAVLVIGLPRMGLRSGPVALALMFGPTALATFGFSRRPLRFGLALGAIFLCGRYYHLEQEGQIEETARSFFGVHRVTIDSTGGYNQLVHGNTLHGIQSRDPAQRRKPLFYYFPTGPIGQIFRTFGATRRNVAITGLGVGGLCAYSLPSQKWTYYEIDPVVERLAKDPRYFTYLRDSPAHPQVVMGDARLSLANVPNNSFDLMVMDAFTSDSIPIHLLTREAIRLYLSKLQPGGILCIHISNRHFDMEPVAGNLMRDAGLFARARLDSITPAEEKQFKAASHWVVAARDPRDIAPLLHDPRWRPVRTNEIPVWTDDYSSILSALRWQ